MNSWLILVNGMPGTGKTTLSKRLGLEFGLEVVHKDELKEFFFDTMRIDTQDDSRFIGSIVLEIEYVIMREFLAKGKPLIIECPMHYDFARTKIKEILKQTKGSIIEINCNTEKNIRRGRVLARAESGNRHPAHILAETFLASNEPEPTAYRPLNLGKVTTVNTDNFELLDYKELSGTLRSAIKEVETKYEATN